jgi:hypothetical protein
VTDAIRVGDTVQHTNTWRTGVVREIRDWPRDGTFEYRVDPDRPFRNETDTWWSSLYVRKAMPTPEAPAAGTMQPDDDRTATPLKQ